MKISNNYHTPVLICGGRTRINYDMFEHFVTEVLVENEIENPEIVSGCCEGIDLLGEEYAQKHNLDVAQFPAEWKRYGRSAGIIRNNQMLEYINSFENPIVIAFWNGTSKGTGYTINKANKLGIPVYIFNYSNETLLSSGISFKNQRLEFDFNEDEPEDIIPLINHKITKSTCYGNVFYYTFKPNKNTLPEWNRFLLALKHSDDTEAVQHFAEIIVPALMQETGSIDCIIYPLSSSILNKTIISVFEQLSPQIITLEVHKKPASEIQFNWEKFYSKFHGDSNYKLRITNYIENIMNAIHKGTNFSLTKQVPFRFRQYFTDFLYFPDEEIAINSVLSSKNILVLDDVLTTGTTCIEILHMLNSIGYNGDVSIYSVINNRQNI